MDTNDLVSKLVKDLKPIAPLPAPQCCGMKWAIGSMLSMMALFLLLANGLRHDIYVIYTQPQFLLELGSVFLAGTLAGLSAFILRVPQLKISLKTKMMIFIASTIWAIEIVRLLWLEFSRHDTEAVIDLAGHECALHLSILMAFPVIFIFYLLKKGASTHLTWSGYTALLATVSYTYVAMRLLCPIDDAAHLLLWHVSPAIFYAAIGTLAGKFFLKW